MLKQENIPFSCCRWNYSSQEIVPHIFWEFTTSHNAALKGILTAVTQAAMREQLMHYNSTDP